jgi:transcriptional regulator GlxA family with amidase domain
MRAAVLVFPGAEELDVFGPYEVLAAARDLGAALRVDLVSVDTFEPVVLAKGAVVHVHRRYDDGPPAELLIVPGGGWANRAAIGVRKETENPKMIHLLREASAAGATIGAVCTGTMLLLKAGLLNGIPVTTHHSALEDLRKAGIDLQVGRVVDAGQIVTSGGVTSGIDLALWLIERFFGGEMAAKTSEYLEYERRLEAWQRE